jgi:hypothetical protein
MNDSLRTRLAALLVVAASTACGIQRPPPKSQESNVNSHFVGERNFEIATSDSDQADTQCRKLCEETCGGQCYSIMEIYTRCHQENPGLEYPSGLTASERLELCVSRSPGFIQKYPYWYNTTFQSVEGAPPPTKWPCGVLCQ